MQHMLKDPMLCIPTSSQLHDELSPMVGTIKHYADRAQERGGWNALEVDRYDMKSLSLLLTEHAPSVYTMPLFSPEFCAGLLAEAQGMRYQQNAEEEPAFRIPELVLQRHCTTLHAALSVHFDNVLLPLSTLLFGIEASELVSIQLAKYEPTEVGYGNWHVDLDSDFTVVVALSNEHTGGGTEIASHGFGPAIEVPQLPAGHALIFPGKLYLHRGMPVTSGTRNLLVFWSEVTS